MKDITWPEGRNELILAKDGDLSCVAQRAKLRSRHTPPGCRCRLTKPGDATAGYYPLFPRRFDCFKSIFNPMFFFYHFYFSGGAYINDSHPRS